MPGVILVEYLIAPLGELLVQLAVGKVQSARAKKRALAAADLMVLAALHDHHISDGERDELATRCVETLKAAEVDVDVATLLERWQAERRGLESDEAFERQVRELADELDDDDCAKVLAGVEAVVNADADAGGLQRDALAVFRSVLGDRS